MISYAISSLSGYEVEMFEDILKSISIEAAMIVYRDKQTKQYAYRARYFLKYARDFDKVLLHTDYLLAHELGADGVHLQSIQYDDIAKAKALNLFVISSTHTLEEAKKAASLGSDMITYSPVFDSPNKGKSVGLDALKEVVSAVKIPVIALGGIVTKKKIEACKKAGAKGFASIRYFEKVS